jgi:V8-like Glu-specific endopeptidase
MRRRGRHSLAPVPASGSLATGRDPARPGRPAEVAAQATVPPAPPAARSSGAAALIPPVSLLSVLLLLFVAVIVSPVGIVADSARAQLAASVPPVARVYGGTPAIGALFVTNPSGPATHFCTASVVHSPNRDLVITAAHCLHGAAADPRNVIFVPGYHDGAAPYDVWSPVRVVVDGAWASSADPDDDVAFLVMASQGAGVRVEDVTGAERLGIGLPETGIVQVSGYPNTQERPVVCQNRTTALSTTQMRFDCAGFTDGTSGGPFLADVTAATGEGRVIGVIGGYERGGFTPDISYSPTFGPNVAAIYASAVAAS